LTGAAEEANKRVVLKYIYSEIAIAFTGYLLVHTFYKYFCMLPGCVGEKTTSPVLIADSRCG
jgi:hypothetical protein